MSAEADLQAVQDAEDLYRPYRALSKAAVSSFILGLLGLTALMTPLLIVLPLVGIGLGVAALRSIRAYPDELSGRGLAWTAIVLNGLMAFVATGVHAMIYATEVPPGCIRTSFAELQPSKQTPDSPVPPRAKELDGKRVFIKGYVYPDGQQYNIKRFVMVPDMGTCCFGGQPKLTDMVEVTLQDPLRVEFARRKRKLAGVFRVDEQLKPVSGLGGVYYQLDADYVR